MKFKLLSCCVLLFAATFFYAFRLADDPFEELLKKLITYNEEHAQEKVHLHLDKAYYAIGDNIWFKAYVTETYTDKPSQISNTLYVELIDQSNSIKKQLKLPLSAGIAWGDFKLTDSLQAGSYRLRAYTQWMRNAGPDYFYDKTIVIAGTAAPAVQVNKTKPNPVTGTAINQTAKTVAVQFFPEGGNLVENLPSKVGIKAINKAGNGEDITGSIVDNTGTKITDFTTVHLGMGNFLLTPQPGKTYIAKIKLGDGTVTETAIPAALPAGYVLSVNNTDSTKVTVRVYISETLLNQGDIKLVVQHNNIVYTVLKANTSKQVNSFSLPKKDLPAGILHFTLFSPTNIPVTERLIFVNNPAVQLTTSLSNLKDKYAKRGQMDLAILAKDGKDLTTGSFSVSVTNVSIAAPDLENESNILTSLLLTSDLKGYIEKPNYYLLNETKERALHLDNLMLTQGWSRFKWTDITGNTLKAPEFMPELSQEISGTVTTNGKKPVVNGKVSLVSTSDGYLKIDTLTDANGHFSFHHLSFGDSTKFVIQARDAKNSKYVEIKLDITPGQVVTANKNTGDITVNINEAIQGYVQKSQGYFADQAKLALRNNNLQLQEVAIVKKRKSVEKSANMNGAGVADQVFYGKDLTACNTIMLCLANRIAGVTYRNGNFYITRNIRGAKFPEPMQINFNGSFIDVAFLENVAAKDVTTVEVLKSIGMTSGYGDIGRNGVLVITAKIGSESGPIHGMLAYSPKGYTAVREFYSPQYTPDNKEIGEDKRNTVYWNPNLITDASGTGKFSYYNTDQPGSYRVVIEGINDAGHLARKVYTYEVQ